VFPSTCLLLIGAVASLAAAPDAATEVKSVQVEIDAPEGCANADEFFVSLRSRTNLVRLATPDEPRTTLLVGEILILVVLDAFKLASGIV